MFEISLNDSSQLPKTIDLPAVPEDLLTAMDKKWPEQCPTRDMSERDIWIMTGRREVVRYLLDQSRRREAAALGVYLPVGKAS